METGTFLNEDVRELINKSFVPLKYESGRDSEQFQRFNVRATPTYVFLNSKGDEIHRLIGYYNAADLIAELEKVGLGAGK